MYVSEYILSHSNQTDDLQNTSDLIKHQVEGGIGLICTLYAEDQNVEPFVAANKNCTCNRKKLG